MPESCYTTFKDNVAAIIAVFKQEYGNCYGNPTCQQQAIDKARALISEAFTVYVNCEMGGA